MAVAGAVLIILRIRKGPEPPAHYRVRRASAGPTPTRIIPAILFAASIEPVLVELLLAGVEPRWR